MTDAITTSEVESIAVDVLNFLHNLFVSDFVFAKISRKRNLSKKSKFLEQKFVPVQIKWGLL